MRLSEQDIIRKLQAAADRQGTYLAIAAQLGISPQYLCDIMHGRRAISARVAEKLGYRQVVEYESLLTIADQQAA